MAAAIGAASPTAAKAVTVTARAREARIVWTSSGKRPGVLFLRDWIDVNASHDEHSPVARRLALRHCSTPVTRHAVRKPLDLTEPQVTGRQKFYLLITPKGSHPGGPDSARHPFASP
ncbi:hypothetical protein Smic_74250 [Streptomyces microflavus]|uniref:Uncharacterized protein n=1 Tax=Streptomyces microflavus TaxID=1919 RepID=A0A7J0D2Z9_STRMI|nr:hypothetical protein Smic_74250 [Streptomyces microflavus]